MPTKTAVKKVNGTAVKEAEEGTTPTTAPAASVKERSAEEKPAKSSESNADTPESSTDNEKTKPKKPPTLVEVQQSLYKRPKPPASEDDDKPKAKDADDEDEELDLWVSPEFEVTQGDESRKIQFVFPRMTTVTPNRQFLRKIYNLDPLFQYFEWMNLAQIPPFIQDLTDGLTDEQFNDLFDGWFQNAEVDAPK